MDEPVNLTPATAIALILFNAVALMNQLYKNHLLHALGDARHRMEAWLTAPGA